MQNVCTRQIDTAQIVGFVTDRLHLEGLHFAAGQIGVQQRDGAVVRTLNVQHAVAVPLLRFKHGGAAGALDFMAFAVFAGFGPLGDRAADQIAVFILHLDGHGGPVQRFAVFIHHPDERVGGVDHVQHGGNARGAAADHIGAALHDFHGGPVVFRDRQHSGGVSAFLRQQERSVQCGMGGVGGLHQRGQILRVHAGLAGHGLPQSVPAFLVVAHVQRLGILVGGDLLNGEGILQLAAAPQGKGGGLLAVFVLPDGIGALLSGQKLGKLAGDVLTGFTGLRRRGGRFRRGGNLLGADRQRTAGAAQHRGRQQSGDAPFCHVVHRAFSSFCCLIVSALYHKKGCKRDTKNDKFFAECVPFAPVCML